jgi:hypothetical protein
MSDSLKMKKLIQQQINSGALNSFFNKGQVNNLNVGKMGQSSLNVIGNQNVDGLFIADKIGINTSNPTKPFEVNSCTVFEGKISVSASTGSAPYTSTVLGTDTKFKKLFNVNDLIIFPNASNIEIYGIITVVTDNVTLDIELFEELTDPIDNVNYQGYYINPGTININSNPLNLKQVIGTNTLFNSYFKNGDKFITINNGELYVQTVNNIISDTELYVSGIFPDITPASGLSNYCAVIYDIIDDYGNMGLGTYNPTEKLDVDGNINLSGHIFNNGTLVEVSPWNNSAFPATPPYTQNIYYNLGYVGIGNVSSNPAYLLDVYGSVRFQDTIINSTTDSTNITTGALTTPGGVGITKNLNVGGTFTATGLISANGGITVPTANSVLINGTSTLTVGGTLSANGGITVPTAKTVIINGTSTLTVGTGATTLGGTLTTTGLTSANGGITVPTGQSVSINGTSTLTVAGLISANGGITVPTAQAVLINGTSTLTVGTGTTTLGGALTTTGLTSANGGITVPTAQTVLINGTSTLTVGTGSTILGGTLTTTGLTSANGGITVPTGQSVLINGTSTLTVGTGATTLGGVLNVTTALTTLSNGLTVLGTNGISLNSTTNTINIGDGANNNNINIGTSGARTLTVGNNTAGTKVNITAGTTNATDGVVMTGNAYLNNKCLNYVDITSMATNSDPAPTGIVFVNGYFLQNGGMTGALNFTTPTAANIVAAVKNCIVGSCFKFTINNKGGGFTRTIVGGAGVDITNLISSGVATNKVATFLCRITNIGSGTEAVVLYDTVV